MVRDASARAGLFGWTSENALARLLPASGDAERELPPPGDLAPSGIGTNPAQTAVVAIGLARAQRVLMANAAVSSHRRAIPVVDEARRGLIARIDPDLLAN